jgi:hypothetical protein
MDLNELLALRISLAGESVGTVGIRFWLRHGECHVLPTGGSSMVEVEVGHVSVLLKKRWPEEDSRGAS